MIKGHHRDFARAVVALARQHKMDRIECAFEENFSLSRENEHSTQRVSLTWKEGRHGAQSRIVLNAHATIHESEEIDKI